MLTVIDEEVLPFDQTKLLDKFDVNTTAALLHKTVVPEAVIDGELAQDKPSINTLLVPTLVLKMKLPLTVPTPVGAKKTSIEIEE